MCGGFQIASAGLRSTEKIAKAAVAKVKKVLRPPSAVTTVDPNRIDFRPRFTSITDKRRFPLPRRDKTASSRWPK